MPASKVHSQIALVLAAMKRENIRPFEELSPQAARDELSKLVRSRRLPAPAMAEVLDFCLTGAAGAIHARLYRPQISRTTGGVVYFHGGGHVIGNLDTHDTLVRSLCAKSGTIFVSVDYRLAPEHKFPAAVDDAFSALKWVTAHGHDLGIDSKRLAVAGDSAGANLAAVVAILARDAAITQLKLQVLAYPVTDYRLIGESYSKFAEGYGALTRSSMEWYRRLYLNSMDEALHWRTSPILAKDLSGVAPALVISAECDVLHDDAVRYVEALTRASVEVQHRDFAGMIHGFLPLAPAVDAAEEAQSLIGERIVDAFQG